jgi:AraC family transcriptional activator of pobA
LHQKNLAADTQHFSAEIIQHLFSALLYELAGRHRKYNAGFKVKITRKEDLLMRFMKLLPEHFKEERSVQFYADLLFVTPKYLSQTVKEISGKTAGELIDQMVITEAKILLSDLSSSIAQVAESLYFSDQFFFSKYFKNQTGTTPREYRTMA